MINLGNLQIPTFLVFLLINGIVIGFIIWRKKIKLHIRSENVFDFLVCFFLVSILTGRILYVIQNFDQFNKLSWSIFPYYYIPGAERIWFKQMPWILIKFWGEEGIIHTALMFGGILYSLLIFKYKNIQKKYMPILVRALCFGTIIQIIGFFISGDYLGKITNSVIGMKYPIDNANTRIPLQVIEICILIILLFIFRYLKRVRKSRLILGIFLFVFGWLEIIIEFLRDKGGENGSGIVAVQIAFLFFVLVGILNITFVLQKKSKQKKKYIQPASDKFSYDSNLERKPPSRVTLSYRDFQSSYSDYKRSPLSVFTRLKRRFFGKRKQDRENAI
ncbi:prolipoprotein diacylglyceryl transferase family protein [Patescibacteria group bacterium]